MPRIFDNIKDDLLPALRQTLEVSARADFCVGYFNLRGWKSIDGLIDQWDGGADHQCRLLVGMQRLPHDDLREAYSLLPQDDQMSNQTVIRLKRRLAEEFRTQLTMGAPTDADEAGLRKLSAQLKAGQVVVKLYLRHTLHAKLYLCFRPDLNNPITGFLGSSNLTFSGLSNQGELNVDVLDHDATKKLEQWFKDRWNDKWCVDITKELIAVIDESWARPDCPPPYQIYVKMAYHLAEEARAGLSEFDIPADMRGVLLEFQSAAVRIAAKHLEKRGGVILGDVVGLGKTLMATALARMFQDPPRSLETLILCPKNLVGMWEDYAHTYRLVAKVVSVTQAQNVLPDMRRYRVVIIDESHNLRNREGKRWAVVRDYIARNASKCILLSATPYNKAYLDLANQLRLFLEPEDVVGIRPEEYLRNDCDGRPDEFTRRHQCALNCLSAFEKSSYPDDWREMMRLFMVRRTRSFVERNYAFTECPTCHTIVLATQQDCPRCTRAKALTDRRFLVLGDGVRFHFPKRQPKALTFRIRDKHPDDQYARLYATSVVDKVRQLHLPRYGLANYLKPPLDLPPSNAEAAVLDKLSRAGKRLIGFCRTNLFKRLESSGHSFLLSVRRHILRNYIYLYALGNGLPLPIGTQDSALFDTRSDDHDSDSTLFGDEEQQARELTEITAQTLGDFLKVASDAYAILQAEHGNKFEWLRPNLFDENLAVHLEQDAQRLFSILELVGDWQAAKDEKLAELYKLLTQTHPHEKVLVFSQFADTVNYLNHQLNARGLKKFAAVTGDVEDPSTFARRFSPVSNKACAKVSEADELRVLVATDVLSEGQNLQDGAIVVNFDLPWAIIRLIQRAGRVDRIGQKAEEILCYSFIPAEGVERVISLRARVRQRLQENAEVVGTDENFFEDEQHDSLMQDLFTEKSGILDDPEDDDVDLASLAYQIWKNACDVDPSLKKTIPDMANVAYSTKALSAVPVKSARAGGASPKSGAMVYVRTSDGNDALAWVDEVGQTVTESQHSILRAAACEPSTPLLPRLTNHHALVQQAVTDIHTVQQTSGGQLGKPGNARRRAYERLKDYAVQVKGGLFDIKPLHQAIDAIYAAPLTEAARDLLNREMRSGMGDEQLVALVLSLHEEDRLCVQQDDVQAREPSIICSLGIRKD
ncbi:helicase-related protein [Rhodoferax antarcticus]|uniref:helicase-related protein n=1 Tax=Rhodoferax antarcticus TaxID=81479 RepID=UPI0022244A2D|nr:helicase-related protein [Rhodoferax antarcticus]MCW2310697.1 superfamily II DNA or RNA helicase [Rhodoferax antarcticus]